MNAENKMSIQTLTALIKDEPNQIANLANASALLNDVLEDINWVGFYVLKNGELVLGPFQGKPACVRIPLGKGVCGTAALNKEIVRVADVHAFPGHIACDPASRSEIVIPIFKADAMIGVLDVDSASINRFSEEDQQLLEAFAETLSFYL
ncbi:MAG: GAF domain-containing protein [Sporolactobacillus sp.]